MNNFKLAGSTLGATALMLCLSLSVRAEAPPSLAQVEEAEYNSYSEREFSQPTAPTYSDPYQTNPSPSAPDNQVGQRDIEFLQPTRSGPSYIGIGANIGIGEGDTAIGETSFAAFSKIGITPNLSARPAIFISDDPTILLPLTFDFIPSVTEATERVTERVSGLTVSPYVGGGLSIAVGDDAAIDFLATGGVDVPLSQQITATAAVNASLFENPAVGIMLGVGYNLR